MRGAVSTGEDQVASPAQTVPRILLADGACCQPMQLIRDIYAAGQRATILADTAAQTDRKGIRDGLIEPGIVGEPRMPIVMASKEGAFFSESSLMTVMPLTLWRS